jgi:hypothetical protein
MGIDVIRLPQVKHVIKEDGPFMFPKIQEYLTK